MAKTWQPGIQDLTIFTKLYYTTLDYTTQLYYTIFHVQSKQFQQGDNERELLM